MKVVAIIQARMSSTRLPGKVLLDIAGEPMLSRCVNRTLRAKMLDEVIVATTLQPHDEVIANLCSERSWTYFRGSEDDVLDRYYRAAETHLADVVVRITSDCPLIDPEIVDKVVREFLDRQSEVDYASNIFPKRTFPQGLDTEVVGFDVLEHTWREDLNPAWREHVTTHIQRNPSRYRICSVTNEEDYSHMRWTVDTLEDLDFVRRIYEYFNHDRFAWKEVLSVIKKYPEWLEINRNVKQKAVH